METAAAQSAVLVAHSIEKSYRVSRPPRVVLKSVTLDVRRGEFLALMGPSGCGKSTLLHILGGLEPPDSGQVSIEGDDIYELDDDRLSAFRRDRIGFVFQFFNLMPSLTAAENIALPLRLRDSGVRSAQRLTKQAINERVTTLMGQLNLHGLQGHGPEEISGGEQQRVAIARALAAFPALLLADEPTGNLDWTTGHEVMSLLARLCRTEHQTTVLVTHAARVAAYADRVLVMRDGSIVDQVDLEHDPNSDWAQPPAAGQLIERLTKLNL